MEISLKLLEYLEWKNIDYELVHHSRTGSSMETTEVAHVPGDRFAKCVVLTDDQDFIMAVVPATHHLDLARAAALAKRTLRLATEPELARLFGDCAPGAVPPVGNAYGVASIIDETLTGESEIWFEAGDHTDIVHVSGDDFRRLVEGSQTGVFSRHLGH